MKYEIEDRRQKIEDRNRINDIDLANRKTTKETNESKSN